MNPIIEIKDASASYGEDEILHQVSFQAAAGEFVVIIGPSGCGKTTLLKIINGLVVPESGEVFVDGQNLACCDLISLRRTIGYAVQGARLFPHMTVENNICYVPCLNQKMTKPEKKTLSSEMLQLLQLPPDMGKRFPSQLSGGQQQRVGIGRALAARPKLLLLDEPFGAVDEITRRGLQQELLSLHQKMKITTIFVTHDIREACKLGERIVIMKDGEIIQQGPPGELKEHPRNAFVKELLGNND